MSKWGDKGSSTGDGHGRFEFRITRDSTGERFQGNVHTFVIGNVAVCFGFLKLAFKGKRT
jgi:hypothetical protein